MQKLFKVTLKVTKKCNLKTLVKYVTKHNPIYNENRIKVLPKKIILLKIPEEKIDVLRADSKKIGFDIKIKEYIYDAKKANKDFANYLAKVYLGDDNKVSVEDLYNEIISVYDKLKDKKDLAHLSDFLNLKCEKIEPILMSSVPAAGLFIYNRKWERLLKEDRPGFGGYVYNSLYDDDFDTVVYMRSATRDGKPTSTCIDIVNGTRMAISDVLVYPLHQLSRKETLIFLIVNYLRCWN